MALPTTDVEIVNLALDNLCHTVQVGNLSTDQSPEAKAARRWFDTDRDRALAAFPWKWAERQAVLTAAVGQSHSKWEYFYTVPTGMVPGTGRFPDPTGARRLPGEQEPFEVLLNAAGTGQVIACNIEPESGEAPLFEFTYRVTDPTLYTQEFVNFLAWLLAADLAKPVLKDKEGRIRMNCLQEAANALAEAKVAELVGQAEGPDPVTPSVAARG